MLNKKATIRSPFFLSLSYQGNITELVAWRRFLWRHACHPELPIWRQGWRCRSGSEFYPCGRVSQPVYLGLHPEPRACQCQPLFAAGHPPACHYPPCHPCWRQGCRCEAYLGRRRPLARLHPYRQWPCCQPHCHADERYCCGGSGPVSTPC